MNYIFKRLIFSILMLLGITIIAFSISVLIPGDPAELALSGNNSLSYTKEELYELKKKMGLDKSYAEQYIIWIKSVKSGTWGKSFVTEKNVIDDIKDRFPKTLLLSLFSLVISIFISLIFGVLSVLFKDKILENFIDSMTSIFISIPSFWFALILMYVFSMKLKILPTSGTGTLKHYILPVLTLSISTIGVGSRFVKSLIKTESTSHYVLVAKSKGLEKFYIIRKHILPNILIVLIAYFGNYFSTILGGSIIIESVFSINGLGKYALDSVQFLDYPALQGYVLVTGITYIVINLVIDIFYCFINPQIKIGEK